MCEVMEKYIEEAVQETLMKSIIEEGCDYNASREDIVDKLIRKCNLTETEANAKYDEYAPIAK